MVPADLDDGRLPTVGGRAFQQHIVQDDLHGLGGFGVTRINRDLRNRAIAVDFPEDTVSPCTGSPSMK